jgi:hypothetical protein
VKKDFPDPGKVSSGKRAAVLGEIPQDKRDKVRQLLGW